MKKRAVKKQVKAKGSIPKKGITPRMQTTSRSEKSQTKTPRRISRGVDSKINSFLKKQGKGTSAKYQRRLKTYLNVYRSTEKSLDAAMKKTVRELDLNRDNRLKQVGVTKGRKGKYGRKLKGKRLWVDEKTGKRVAGKQVQTIVRNSIKYKSVQVLAAKRKLSYEKAQKQFDSRVNKTASKIRKSEKFKKEISKWKKQGLTKREINERILRVAEGRAKARVIRQINPSPEMKHTVIETSEL